MLDCIARIISNQEAVQVQQSMWHSTGHRRWAEGELQGKKRAVLAMHGMRLLCNELRLSRPLSLGCACARPRRFMQCLRPALQAGMPPSAAAAGSPPLDRRRGGSGPPTCRRERQGQGGGAVGKGQGCWQGRVGWDVYVGQWQPGVLPPQPRHWQRQERRSVAHAHMPMLHVCLCNNSAIIVARGHACAGSCGAGGELRCAAHPQLSAPVHPCTRPLT